MVVCEGQTSDWRAAEEEKMVEQESLATALGKTERMDYARSWATDGGANGTYEARGERLDAA